MSFTKTTVLFKGPLFRFHVCLEEVQGTAGDVKGIKAFVGVVSEYIQLSS